MSSNLTRVLLAVLFGALAACHAPVRPEPAAAPVHVRLIAINDLHGYLEPSPLHLPPESPPVDATAGGIVALAGIVEQLREGQPHSLLIAAGDLVGASPLSSALLRDEPTLTALNRLGLSASAVGNHEFDRGLAELQRLQAGGCPATGCSSGEVPFAGARFPYLAANVVDIRTGEAAFPAVHIEQIEGVRIAFLGAVLRGAPEVILADNIAGLRFDDEVASLNAWVPKLRAQGVRAIVVLIHEGAVPEGAVETATCLGLRGPIVEIAPRLDPEIDVIVSGHSHQAYACRLGGRWLTQAGSYGQQVTALDLTLDPRSGDIVSTQAANVLVDPAKPSRDPFYAELVHDAIARARVIASTPIARLAVPQISRTLAGNGESPLGRLLADAQLEATAPLGAQIACMNAGGIRQHVPATPAIERPLTYGDLYAAQPFGNRIQVLTLTGAQLVTLLEQQWQKPAVEGLLSCSRGFSYHYDTAKPIGQRVRSASLTLNGQPVRADAIYRIAVNNFLANGGDSFPILKDAPRLGEAGSDLDALAGYLKAHEPAAPTTDARAIGLFRE